jgi:hypothetical protein
MKNQTKLTEIKSFFTLGSGFQGTNKVEIISTKVVKKGKEKGISWK